jgi:hypothetical protein
MPKQKAQTKGKAKIKKVMEEFKDGKLKSGPGGKGGTVKKRGQAIAIALSEAREAGARIPRKKS